MEVGRSIPRMDVADEVTGRAKCTDDLCLRPVLKTKVLRSTIANGWVKFMDISATQTLSGVVKALTCFDVPDIQCPVPGHPWSVEEAHQDVSDRKLLDRRVRIYGGDITAVVTEDEITTRRALGLIRVEYEEYPVALEAEQTMAEGVPVLHEEHPDDVLTKMDPCMPMPESDFYGMEDVLACPAHYQFRGRYNTQQVRRYHVRDPISYARTEGGHVVAVTSTQIPHAVRRMIGQIMDIGRGSIRVIKPYIGGDLGNKQKVLYEPLNAWFTTQVGDRRVRLDVSREETFQSTRSRHPISFDVAAAVDGGVHLMARSYTAVSNQGGYTSHGHSIVANAVTGFRQLYLGRIGHRFTVHTVYTSRPAPGAMRSYSIPQYDFAVECMMDDITRERSWGPKIFRLTNFIPLGYVDPSNGITYHFTGLAECIEKGAGLIGWVELREEYKEQSGPVRRGVGMACFSYKTGVYPISLGTTSARLVLNQGGTVQLHLGVTEIGQGGGTMFSQMAAQAIGVPTEDVHIASFQDADTASFDIGAYASQQAYVTGKAIREVGGEFREELLTYAAELFPNVPGLDIRERQVMDGAGEALISLTDLAMNAFYSLGHNVHITTRDTSHCKENIFTFGCYFAGVGVDIPVNEVRVLHIVNVHDSRKLVDPALTEAQIHGDMSIDIGYALTEEMKFGPKTGRLLNGNLSDYKMPTSVDHPELTALFVETGDPSGPFGNRALGGPPTIPTAPAIHNAVLQTTGVAVNTLPPSPQELMEGFTRGGLV